MGGVLLATGAQAAQIGHEGDLLSVEVHGFASQGFILSTENNYLAKSTNGSFEFSEVGLNFTKPLTDNLRLGLQLFTRKLGPTGDFRVLADWFYVDYRVKDWFGLRVGRVKLPFGLYNDTSDIDSARVSVLLPQSIYPTQNRNFLLAQTGAELYGYVDLERGGTLEYRVYGGAIFPDVATTSNHVYTVSRLSVPYVTGTRLLWETPLEGLHFAESIQWLRLDADLTYGPPNPGQVVLRVPALLWVNSVEYAHRDFQIAAEYSRWYTRALSSNPALFPTAPLTASERAYLLSTYRITRWLQSGAYYSLLRPNAAVWGARQSYQHDLAGTLRFDINPYWLVKAEAHYLMGTAALDPGLNDNTPTSALAAHWALFLVKVTAQF